MRARFITACYRSGTGHEQKRAILEHLFGIRSPAGLPYRCGLIVGCGFIEHGAAKQNRGIDTFANILHTLSVPAPHFMAWLTVLTEVFGGIAVLLGAFVPLVSLPMAAILLVAILTVHLPYGFSSIKLLSVEANGARFGPVGYETDVLYLACLAALVLGGLDLWQLRDVSKHKTHRAKVVFETLAQAIRTSQNRRELLIGHSDTLAGTVLGKGGAAFYAKLLHPVEQRCALYS